jgi:hypothetical protein
VESVVLTISSLMSYDEGVFATVGFTLSEFKEMESKHDAGSLLEAQDNGSGFDVCGKIVDCGVASVLDKVFGLDEIVGFDPAEFNKPESKHDEGSLLEVQGNDSALVFDEIEDCRVESVLVEDDIVPLGVLLPV